MKTIQDEVSEQPKDANKFRVVEMDHNTFAQNTTQLSSCNNSTIEEHQPLFPAGFLSVKAIYLADEPDWPGVDIDRDNCSTVDQRYYHIMKDFLRKFFCEDEDPENDFNSLLDFETSRANFIEGVDEENVRAIPGGRYGCTQYLKICGPEELRKLSIGRLTQMVQLAIKEDILRYHKTLLVWTTKVDKHKALQEQDPDEDQTKAAMRESKLAQVKQALLEILAESK